MNQQLLNEFASLMQGTFLEEDRNSNFPFENTLPMTSEHPITPPPELIKEWIKNANHNESMFAQVAIIAANWGADQQLEACCERLEELSEGKIDSSDPNVDSCIKQPGLKEQALVLLQSVETSEDPCDSWDFSIIRRALESLPDD